jgi:hypothetical protein
MVDDQRSGHRAEVDQMMPVTVVAGQPRSFQRKHGTDGARADCCQQPSETWAFYRAGTGAALIFIDHGDTLKAQQLRTFTQIVLPSLSFQPCAYLLHRRLPNINAGASLSVYRSNLLAHRSPLLLFRSRR